MSAFYNEIEPFAVKWLAELEHAGHITPGVIDSRSIGAVEVSDLTAPQCHFFAGIGGWSYALRLAGWPDDAPVWTGSCPCQPFSVAGKGKGTDDPRHLWPAWFRLIEQCRPPTIFGEQVAGPAGWVWFDAVSADLEEIGYSVGAADLCAAGVGAPHLRQRLYFVAIADSKRCNGVDSLLRTESRALSQAAGRGQAGGVADPDSERDGDQGPRPTDIASSSVQRTNGERERLRLDPWQCCDHVPCTDGKSRPIEPGSFPLAHGVPARVGRLRGYGNAIVPQVAAQFIRAVMA